MANPFEFIQQVRAEATKVVWPSRRETLITTGLVMLMAAFAAIFLLGLSLHRPLNLKSSTSISILFRLVGLVLLISGLSWTVAAHNKMLLPGSVGVTSAQQLSTIATRGRNFPEAIALTNRALEWSPLDWELYFLRAAAELGEKQPEKALDDFRRAVGAP